MVNKFKVRTPKLAGEDTLRSYELLVYIVALSLLILLAIVITYYPGLAGITLLVVLTFMVLSFYITRRSIRKRPKLYDVIADDVRGGVKLFEVDSDEVSKLVERDLILQEEIRKYGLKSFIDSIMVFIVFTWYFIYFIVIIPRLGITDLTSKFIAYLIGFLVPFILYTVFELKFREKRLTYVLRGYEVYDKGIISSSQYIVLKFPLVGYNVREFSSRKCFEISKEVSRGYRKQLVRFLLYTKNLPKMREILSSYGGVKFED